MVKTLAAVLVVGSAISIPIFDLAKITFTGDRILGIVAVLFLGVRILSAGFRWTPVHSAMAVFVATQLLTTALNAGTWPRGMMLVTVYLLGFACFALMADVVSERSVRRFAIQLLIVVGAIAGLAAGLLAITANLTASPIWA